MYDSTTYLAHTYDSTTYLAPREETSFPSAADDSTLCFPPPPPPPDARPRRCRRMRFASFTRTHDRPMICSVSGSMRSRNTPASWADPGWSGTRATSGTTNPRPALSLTSPMGKVNLRRALRVRVVRERILRLRHADGQVIEPLRGELRDFFLRLRAVRHVRGAVQFLGDGGDFFLDGGRVRVQQLEVGGVLVAPQRLARRRRRVPPRRPPRRGACIARSRCPPRAPRSRITSCSASVSVGKTLTATTTGTPNFLVFSTCLARFATPLRTSSTSSLVYECDKGLPGDTAGPPP